MNGRMLVFLSLLTGAAAILHIVETWLPLPLPLPGAKLGLANIVSLTVLIWLGWRPALLVTVCRVLLAALFSGSLLGPAFLMSLTGAVGSLLIMAAAHSWGYRLLSVIGISVIGAVSHNALQLMVAATLMSSGSILWYLPWLVLLAIPTGIITGACAAVFTAHASRLPVGRP